MGSRASGGKAWRKDGGTRMVNRLPGENRAKIFVLRRDVRMDNERPAPRTGGEPAFFFSLRVLAGERETVWS